MALKHTGDLCTVCMSCNVNIITPAPFFTVSNDQTCELVNAPMYRQLGKSSAKRELSTIKIRSKVNRLVKGRRKLFPYLLLVSKALRTIRLNGILVKNVNAIHLSFCHYADASIDMLHDTPSIKKIKNKITQVLCRP